MTSPPFSSLLQRSSKSVVDDHGREAVTFYQVGPKPARKATKEHAIQFELFISKKVRTSIPYPFLMVFLADILNQLKTCFLLKIFNGEEHVETTRNCGVWGQVLQTYAPQDWDKELLLVKAEPKTGRSSTCCPNFVGRWSASVFFFAFFPLFSGRKGGLKLFFKDLLVAFDSQLSCSFRDTLPAQECIRSGHIWPALACLW